MTDFIFLGSKTIADSDCCHEIKRCLFLGRKAMTKPREHIKMKRHHFANIAIVKAMVFPTVVYKCEN